MQIKNASPYRTGMLDLLRQEGLPTDDIGPDLDSFLVVLQDSQVIGSVGIEIYGRYGLLRSLAVSKTVRNKGIGDGLLKHIEQIALENQLIAIYLLTETAPAYFKKKGYQQVERTTMPAEIQGSSEFSHVCPVSAIAMKKELK